LTTSAKAAVNYCKLKKYLTQNIPQMGDFYAFGQYFRQTDCIFGIGFYNNTLKEGGLLNPILAKFVQKGLKSNRIILTGHWSKN